MVKIANGITEQKFDSNELNEIGQIRKKFNMRETDFVFLYIGRLVPQKGIQKLIGVFKSIFKERSEGLKLILVGDGTMQDHLKKECDNI